MSLMACSFEYGTPDKLDMANATVGERIVIGLEVALLGIGVVFVVLALLIAFIVLFKYGFKGLDVLKAKLKKQPKVEDKKIEEDTSEQIDRQEDIQSEIINRVKSKSKSKKSK